MNLKIKTECTPHHRWKNKNATATSKIAISTNATTTTTTSCCHHECDVSLHAGWGAVALQWQPTRHNNIKCGCCPQLMHLHTHTHIYIPMYIFVIASVCTTYAKVASKPKRRVVLPSACVALLIVMQASRTKIDLLPATCTVWQGMAMRQQQANSNNPN